MVDTYYKRAPIIVERINHSPKKDEICEFIYGEICKLMHLFENQEYDDIAARYLAMMYHVDLLTMNEV